MLKTLTVLAEKEYNKERNNPNYNQDLYLHLSDLYIALKKFSTKRKIKILDFGCGGSPYRSFFPNAQYHRADFQGSEDIDFAIDKNSKLKEIKKNSYDLVLSTQVLEHVNCPKKYLYEAKRILKKGGRLILSTHGVFYDHPCPFDFWRWTADGLKKEISDSGFKIFKIYKMTTNRRAALLIADHFLSKMSGSWLTKDGFFLRLLQKMFWRKREMRHKWADNKLENERIVKGTDRNHVIYIGLLCVAKKTKP